MANHIWSDPFKDLPQAQSKREDAPAPSSSADISKKRAVIGEGTVEEPANLKRSKGSEEREEHQTAGQDEVSKVPEVKEALEKISKGLCSSKKFVKAVDVLLQLMERTLPTEQEPGVFIQTVTEFLQADQNIDRLVGTTDEQAAAKRWYEALEKESARFSDWEKVVIGTLHLLGPIRETLATDDSFTFRRATSKIKEMIEALAPIVEDTVEMAQRRKALLVCLRTAFKKNIFAWAKPPIEDIFLAASERRLLFTEEERGELDDMYTELRTKQRSASVNPTGTVVSRSVRLVNSTAHPLKNKATDLYK